MKDFTVIMAIVDFIPVILFAAAAVLLQRDLYSRMSKGAFALFAAGTIDVFCAGTLKAVYKLLYAAGICDFETLSTLFFPLQAIGFLLAGIAIIAMLSHNQSSKVYSLAAVPVVWNGTMLFVILMVLGLGGMNIGLSVISRRMGKKSAILFFVLSFVFSLIMGYLSSRDFTQGFMNWVAQGINILGQGSLFVGAMLLHKVCIGKDAKY